eukprot:PhM_4_TR15968/c1_g1_i11/m.45670
MSCSSKTKVPFFSTQIVKMHNNLSRIFQLLRKQFKKHRPKIVIALDETSVLWYPSSSRTYEDRGKKVIRARVHDEKKCSTALLGAVMYVAYDNNDEPFLDRSRTTETPPYITVKGPDTASGAHSVNDKCYNIAEELRFRADGSPGVIFGVSGSGWINERLFKT